MLKKIVISVSLLLCYHTSLAIDFSTLSSRENSCPGANVSQTIYIPNGQTSFTETVWDAFWHPQDRFIANNGTLVKLWQSENNLITGCNSSSDWSKASDIAPGNNQQIIALYSRCTFNRPQNINNRTAQFVFNIRHGAIGGGTTNETRYYYPRSGWYNNPATRQSKTLNNYFVSNYQVHENECLNITLEWCGDGERNGTETCDPNDNVNKEGWGNGGCNSSCDPINIHGTSGGSPSSACYLGSSYGTISPTILVSTGGVSPNCTYDITFGPIRKNDGSIVDGTNITNTGSLGCDNINVDTIISSGSLAESVYSSCGLKVISNTGTTARISLDRNCSSINDIYFNLNFSSRWNNYGNTCNTEDSSSSSSSSSIPSNTCGDGIIQRPNSSGLMEECDFGNGTWPDWCQKTTCEILENTTPGGLTDSNSSTPSGGTILLSPGNSLLLGGGMGVFEYLTSNNAYIQNNSTSDIYIDKKLCVYKNGFEYNAMNGTNICSNGEVGFLSKNGGKKNLYVADDKFVANISSMPSTKTYVDGEIITTLEGLQSTNSFLKSILKVRVAKSTVNTIGGGASLLNGTRFSDVNILSQGWGLLNPELNRNLILTSLGINPLSSYTKTITDTEFISKSKTDGNNDLSGFNEKFGSGNTSVINTLPNQKFNGLENVFVQVGNVNLSSQTINGGNKTFIVEDGNLNINGNITSSDNILFVVKNGDIIIKNNVTKIDAIIINIGGEIKAEDDSTNNRLVVNGAIYGKVDDLLGKRTYIKDRGEYVDVGTNVNFTSKVFTSPPPLLSKFLGEYMEGNKIPK